MAGPQQMHPVRTYRDFIGWQSRAGRLRVLARTAAVALLASRRSIGSGTGWIRFPYYHHVFDDERRGFESQLRYLKQFGDFISLDEAVEMLRSGVSIDGRYFCVTFDDGFKNCVTNAVPILLDRGVSACFFLPTDFIGADVERDRGKLLEFFAPRRVLVEFVDWADCRAMMRAGMAIGSHTVTHARLSELTPEDARAELSRSKQVIEERVGRVCEHFCVPFGHPHRDFIVDRDPALARELGYRSVLTARRGASRRGDSAYAIRRDHLLASWGNYQLRYFLSL